MSEQSLTKLATVAGSTALASGAAVIIGWMATSSVEPNYLAKWHLSALAGCVGSIVGAQFGTNGNSWLKRN